MLPAGHNRDLLGPASSQTCVHITDSQQAVKLEGVNSLFFFYAIRFLGGYTQRSKVGC